MMTYQEQIKHPKWQKKRLEVLKLHKFTCQVCRAKDEELHVHHPYYKRGAMVWEYDKKELECLCHRCHKDAHAIDEKIKKALATCRDKERVLAFILRPTDTPPANKPAREKPVYPMLDAAIKGYRDKIADLEAQLTSSRLDLLEERHKITRDEAFRLMMKEEDEAQRASIALEEEAIKSAEGFFAKMKMMMG